MHPQASQNYNKKAEELLMCLRPAPDHLKPKDIPHNPNIHISHQFTQANIIVEMGYGWTEFTGNVAARAFGEGGQMIGLFDEDHTNLVRLAEAIQKSIIPRGVVSLGLLSELIFDWLKQQRRGASISMMTEYVLAECEKQIKEMEVWIPISLLYIESPFILGKITFRAITKAMVDDWENSAKAKLTEPEESDSVKQFFERIRKEIQGLATATIKVQAEPRRAYEIAAEESEKAMNMLRIFTPANFHPSKICYSAPWGKQHQDSDRYLLVQDGKIIGHTSGFSDKSRVHWNLSNEELQMNIDAGLGVLSNLLKADRLTDFQKTVLEALFLYSRSSLAKQLSDRLVYILVALESVFLKDSNEPIQDNISLRMAYMQPISVEERRAITRNVRATYSLRSSFIHHGHSISVDDIATLQEFVKNAWFSLQALIPLAATEITKEEFFNNLEDRRLAG
jgi:hypothetical protein